MVYSCIKYFFLVHNVYARCKEDANCCKAPLSCEALVLVQHHVAKVTGNAVNDRAVKIEGFFEEHNVSAETSRLANRGYKPSGPFASKDPPNLIYVKVEKAASSTTGGVARRIAARHGLSCVGDDGCDWKSEPGVQSNHTLRSWFHELPSKKPILWLASIRDPLDRCMSHYYHFGVNKKHVSQSTETKLEYMKSWRCSDYQWQYLKRSDDDSPQKTLEAYNFTVLAERYHESMALMIRTLGLDLTDALYLPSKESSTFLEVPHKSFDDEPSEVQAFGRSDEFKAQNKFDYELWHSVNNRMSVQMQEQANQDIYSAYMDMLNEATSKCHTDCVWSFGLNAQENISSKCGDCYWHDAGCGHACFDMLFPSV